MEEEEPVRPESGILNQLSAFRKRMTSLRDHPSFGAEQELKNLKAILERERVHPDWLDTEAVEFLIWAKKGFDIESRRQRMKPPSSWSILRIWPEIEAGLDLSKPTQDPLNSKRIDRLRAKKGLGAIGKTILTGTSPV